MHIVKNTLLQHLLPDLQTVDLQRGLEKQEKDLYGALFPAILSGAGHTGQKYLPSDLILLFRILPDEPDTF